MGLKTTGCNMFAKVILNALHFYIYKQPEIYNRINCNCNVVIPVIKDPSSYWEL